MTAVKDALSITHEVLVVPVVSKDGVRAGSLAGIATCGARFFVEPKPYHGAYTIGAVQMTKSDGEVTCMACIAVIEP